MKDKTYLQNYWASTIVITIIITFIFTGCVINKPSTVNLSSNNKVTETNSNKQLKVHFIDVGQADSIFIDYGSFDILIDAGNNDDGRLVVNYLKKLNTDDIEILVATHPHEDHIGGIDKVLNAFQVERVIDSGKSHSTKTYKDYLRSAKKEKDAKLNNDANMVFDMGGGAQFKVIEVGDNFEDLNANSVLTLLDYKDIEFLFTGDLETSGEKRLLKKNIEADILKVGHHGSRTSSSDAFLRKVKPKVAIISAGRNNDYGHPHKEVLKRLDKYNTKVYGTWNSGTVVVSTDGKEYTISTIK